MSGIQSIIWKVKFKTNKKHEHEESHGSKNKNKNKQAMFEVGKLLVWRGKLREKG